MKLIRFQVSDELFKAVKHHCVEHEITMSKFFRENLNEAFAPAEESEASKTHYKERENEEEAGVVREEQVPLEESEE